MGKFFLFFSPASRVSPWGSFFRYRRGAGGVTGTIRPPGDQLGGPLPGVGTRMIGDLSGADRAAADQTAADRAAAIDLLLLVEL